MKTGKRTGIRKKLKKRRRRILNYNIVIKRRDTHVNNTAS
jgi:hypothetical protein